MVAPMRHAKNRQPWAFTTEPIVDYSKQLAAWWAHERERDFTKLECGLLGAYFSAIGIGLVVTVGMLFR
jgi:hypothetical protein